jgi:hypothetical protein
MLSSIDFTTLISVSTPRPYTTKVLWIFRKEGYAWYEYLAETEIRSVASGLLITLDQRFAFNLRGLKEFFESDKSEATLSGVPVEASRYNGGVMLEDGVYQYRLKNEEIRQLINDYLFFEE